MQQFPEILFPIKNIWWYQNGAVTFAPVLLKTTYQERQRDMAL
jgi:hypothetical protein